MSRMPKASVRLRSWVQFHGLRMWAKADNAEYSANLPRNYSCHTLTLLSGRSNEC